MKTAGMWVVTTRNVKMSDGRVALYLESYFRKEDLARTFAEEQSTSEIVFRAGRTIGGRFYPASPRLG
jgi:hypothetical protein